MPKTSAVEILVFKPTPGIAPTQRGVHENLWIKQRFDQFLSVGVYLEGTQLKYYFFEHCDKPVKLYDSLNALRQDLPIELKDIFEHTPKLFIMGHGRGDQYGLGNAPVEIYDELDQIITDFEAALPKQHDEIFLTLEACNTDNQAQALKGGQTKTFLARVSERHPHMTICGTGPWDPNDTQTGYRASGGFPNLNAPITSMAGGIWKSGNRVIFYHDNNQLAVKKSKFAFTQTAKELKINTVAYAREILKDSSLSKSIQNEFIKEICQNRNVLKIDDLKYYRNFPKNPLADQEALRLLAHENKIVKKEQDHYIRSVQSILVRLKLNGKLTDKDLLTIALGLNSPAIFKGHEDVYDEVLANTQLLKFLMVTSGKVLLAECDNNKLIDLLLSKGIDINSTDEKGMTALHYAVQNFYNYREEPIQLINKLLSSGADLHAKNNAGKTPYTQAAEHSKKSIVIAGDNLINTIHSHTMKPLLSTQLSFSEKFNNDYLVENRHKDANIQHEYDKRFALALKV